MTPLIQGESTMMRSIVINSCLILAVVLTGLGCARAARDTSGFALREETTVASGYENTWQTVKHVLREQGYEVYTMDKRGYFVAYTPLKRILWMQPKRTKFTVELARLSDNETVIAVESIRQIYGVTLLTHPNWHDRKQNDPAPGAALLEGIRTKLAEGGAPAESFADEVDAAAAKEEVLPVEEPAVIEAEDLTDPATP
ncbi:MAG TPA: hypothetical protein PLZ53_04060 [Candidatus Hydrogenedentes bacterium]|jgi:hypothetical protein|nr:hypothetical protein [Candidatus Hydrogenedentota bacterium]HQB04164.1 hypothetical protein [Candidatus Hydrogenedentota bacterium]